MQVLASSTSASSKINFAYDARNRLTSTSFGDGSPSISQSYTSDGLLNSVTTSGPNGSTWSYGYNNRRLVVSETLALNGSASTFRRDYDANGHMARLGYP